MHARLGIFDMKVLHLAWDDASGRMHIWLERSRQRVPHPPRHPAAFGHAALRRMAGAWLGEALAMRAAPGHTTLVLPTTATGPLASPETHSEPVLGPGSLYWQEWLVPTLAPRDPALLLRRVALAHFPAHIQLGASTRFWLAALAFVDELVARGCFAPYAGDDDSVLLAHWSPVFDAPAAARLRVLATAMPGVCRAARFTDDWHARAPDALPLLTGFIERLLDRRVRRRIRPMLFESLAGNDDTPAARWLSRLAGRATQAYLPVRSLAEHHFGEAVRAWLTPFHIAPQATGRLCVQLDAPERMIDDADVDTVPEPATGHALPNAGNTAATWRLSYFLQDVDEPSVQIPARQIWHAHGRDALIAQRRFVGARRTLLADLARAAPLCLPIAESLRQEAPDGAPLSVEQAHVFLREQAAALEAADIAVRLPAWWKQRPKLKVALTLSDRAAFFGVETLVKFNWHAALGDMVLSRAEFETLSRLKTPLAQVRGHWVEVNADNLKRALRYFERRKDGLPLAEALRADVAEHELDIGVPVKGLSVSGRLRGLLDALRGARKIEPVRLPAGFTGELRPYQERGLAWLAFLSEHGLGACLADDMGLGKTVQLLALVSHWRAQAPANGPVLLICPMSIIGNWQRETARFAPALKVLVHHGADRHGDSAFRRAVRGHDLVLTTYGLAHRDLAALRGVKWRAVVLDEAQNVKNDATHQARAVRQLPARHRIALTGTPVENGLEELWAILDFLNPGYLGSRESFQRRYTRTIGQGDAQRTADLRRLVQPFVLRRVKTDKSVIADLPEKIEHTVYCNLTREQATLYQAVTRDMLERVQDAFGLQRARLILTALTRLKQVCNHPAHFLGDGSRFAGRSGKLARLEAMLEEALGAGDKALVFTQYTALGGPLQRHLQQRFKREVLYLHGQVPQRKRDELVWRFQEEPRGPAIFVLSLKSGGTGLNLTAANHVFHFDRWWNPAVENQATDRAFRIGQLRNVQVHKLVCLGTLEERIDQLLTKKRALAEQVVGEGDAWMSELNTAALRDLVALGAEAVSD